jgi:hypothetical protein
VKKKEKGREMEEAEEEEQGEVQIEECQKQQELSKRQCKKFSHKIKAPKLDVVVHTVIPATQEAQAGGQS